MFSVWTKHLKDQEDRAQFERNLRNSKWILDRLTAILDTMEEDLNRSDLSTKTYEIPNWSFRQAHNNGARQYLRTIKRLINLDQKETDDRQPIGSRPASVRP